MFVNPVSIGKPLDRVKAGRPAPIGTGQGPVIQILVDKTLSFRK
jgi:hypothetical protein